MPASDYIKKRVEELYDQGVGNIEMREGELGFKEKTHKINNLLKSSFINTTSFIKIISTLPLRLAPEIFPIKNLKDKLSSNTLTDTNTAGILIKNIFKKPLVSDNSPEYLDASGKAIFLVSSNSDRVTLISEYLRSFIKRANEKKVKLSEIDLVSFLFLEGEKICLMNHKEFLETYGVNLIINIFKAGISKNAGLCFITKMDYSYGTNLTALLCLQNKDFAMTVIGVLGRFSDLHNDQESRTEFLSRLKRLEELGVGKLELTSANNVFNSKLTQIDSLLKEEFKHKTSLLLELSFHSSIFAQGNI